LTYTRAPGSTVIGAIRYSTRAPLAPNSSAKARERGAEPDAVRERFGDFVARLIAHLRLRRGARARPVVWPRARALR